MDIKNLVQFRIAKTNFLFRTFDELKREYGSLMFSIMELVNGLYINVDNELWTKGSCNGTVGPQGQKFSCSGSAAILHKFCQGKS